jgi:hypothetical protein
MTVSTRHQVNSFLSSLEKEVKGMMKRLDTNGKSVKVGLPADSGNAKVRDKHGVITDSDERLVVVGAIHEFGIGVPMRSFLREPLSRKRREIAAITKLGATRVANGQGTIESVLQAIGETGVSIVVASFSYNDWKPLKDPTRGGKNPAGDAQPLLDTGTLRRSITYEIAGG